MSNSANPLMALLSMIRGNGGVNPLNQAPNSPNLPFRENFFLPEPGTDNFFGRHPGVTRGIENAFLGVANMGPPGLSAGENISNAARSVLGIPQERRQYMAQQLMLPLQWQEMQQKLRLGESEISKNAALGKEAELHGTLYGNEAAAWGNSGYNDPVADFKKMTDPGGPFEHASDSTKNFLTAGAIELSKIANPTTRASRGESLLNQARMAEQFNERQDADKKPSFPDDAILSQLKITADDVRNDPAKAKLFNDEKLRQMGVAAGIRTGGAMGAKGEPDWATQQSIETTRSVEGANIAELRRQYDAFMKEPYANIDVQNQVKGKSPAEHAAIIKKIGADMQNEIMLRSQALDSYPFARMNTRGNLSFDQYLGGLRAAQGDSQKLY